MEKLNEIWHINSTGDGAAQMVARAMMHTLSGIEGGREIVILCIGTDRATGDSLGPLIGHKLERPLSGSGVFVYGTLDKPVHAENIAATIMQIYRRHSRPLVVAVDACLGSPARVGYLNVGRGGVFPGAGVNKVLPCVGDMFITGIVNYNCGELAILQNTRLSVVMRMADIIVDGMMMALASLPQKAEKAVRA